MGLRRVRKYELRVSVIVLALSLRDAFIPRLASVTTAEFTPIEDPHDWHGSKRVRCNRDLLALPRVKDRLRAGPVPITNRGALQGLLVLLRQTFDVMVTRCIKFPPEHVLWQD